MFLVMILGSLVLGVFTLAYLYKISFVLSVLICPLCITKCRKKSNKIPLDFEHFVDEFDFTVGDDEEPACHFDSSDSNGRAGEGDEGKTKNTPKKQKSA